MNLDTSQLFENYSEMVFRLVLRIVPNREESLDLTQEIFVKILEKPAFLSNANNTKGYILKSAYNLALNHKRNQRMRRIIEHNPNNIERPHVPSPEDELAKAEQAQTVERFLTALSPQQREAVLCRFYGEMKLSEIAVELNINEATVRNHLKRALHKLRNLMEAE